MKTKMLLCVLFVISTCLYSTIINVPADQQTIQAGIDTSVDADTVLVQPGIYLENINYNGKLITVASLFLTTQDTTYISQTVIDGNEDGSVVTFTSNEDITAVLTGFTITNGRALYGGGIFCNQSSPSLVNLMITNNYAVNYDPLGEGGLGGGIYCRENSNPSILNVTVSGNSTDAPWGGGSGGGIYCAYSSNPSLANTTITGNSAPEFGGGICCRSSSNPSLVNTTITGNTSEFGGGIYCHNSNPCLVNVTITSNSASGSVFANGGGISCYNSNPSLQNVTITGNSASGGVYADGGGIFCHQSNPSLMNVTIISNFAENHGGGIYCYESSPSLVNCILWNDSPEEISGSATATYTNIQGGWTGTGNIDEDPLFVGTGEDPYSLFEDSPCIDTGIPNTTGLNLPPWDIIGNLRIWDGDGNGSAIIDMGAYEYGSPPYVDIDDNVIVQTPDVFLQQNYPNPFNPTTIINYSLKENSKVLINIYNVKGQKIKQLVEDQLSTGQYSAIWNGKNDNGKLVSSGLYFYKLKTNSFVKTKKMMLMK